MGRCDFLAFNLRIDKGEAFVSMCEPKLLPYLPGSQGESLPAAYFRIAYIDKVPPMLSSSQPETLTRGVPRLRQMVRQAALLSPLNFLYLPAPLLLTNTPWIPCVNPRLLARHPTCLLLRGAIFQSYKELWAMRTSRGGARNGGHVAATAVRVLFSFSGLLGLSLSLVRPDENQNARSRPRRPPYVRNSPNDERCGQGFKIEVSSAGPDVFTGRRVLGGHQDHLARAAVAT